MSFFSSAYHSSAYYSSAYYGLRVERVYTSDADRIITPQAERLMRANVESRLIIGENIERLINMQGISVVSVDSSNRIISIDLDENIINIENIVRLTEAD